MKLYTEEQVKEAYNKGRTDWINEIEDYYIFSELTPIELPSDEEIEEMVEQEYKRHDNNEFLYGRSDETKLAYKAGVWDGLKWLKEQILNQNK